MTSPLISAAEIRVQLRHRAQQDLRCHPGERHPAYIGTSMPAHSVALGASAWRRPLRGDAGMMNAPLARLTGRSTERHALSASDFPGMPMSTMVGRR